MFCGDLSMKITRFENLDCWNEARSLANQVYNDITNIRRGIFLYLFLIEEFLSSIPLLCKEGHGEVERLLTIPLFVAMSSAAEVQSHLYIASDQGFIAEETFDSIYQQADKTNRMIFGLIKYLRTKETKQTKQTR